MNDQRLPVSPPLPPALFFVLLESSRAGRQELKAMDTLLACYRVWFVTMRYDHCCQAIQVLEGRKEVELIFLCSPNKYVGFKGGEH